MNSRSTCTITAPTECLTHRVPDRIVSVSQFFVRPIVRGKAGKPVELGVNLDISIVDG